MTAYPVNLTKGPYVSLSIMSRMMVTSLLCYPASLTLNLWFVLLLWWEMTMKWCISLFLFQPIVVSMKMFIVTVNSWRTKWAVKTISSRTVARLPAIVPTKRIRRPIQDWTWVKWGRATSSTYIWHLLARKL